MSYQKWAGWSSALIACIALVGVYPLRSQDPPRVASAAFMKMKLEPAKSILEGIALKNFDMIQKNADEIRKLTLDEGWMVRQTLEYRKESQRFQKTMSLLSRAAKEEDLEAASLAYMQMTMNCVRCHEMMRDGKP